jgi:hypothetical protein
MSTPFGNGVEITLNQAQDILKNQLELTSMIKPLLKTITPLSGQALVNYYTSDMNAFIFSPDMVNKVLNQPGVDNLMIVFGAHPKTDGNFEVGQPTVILVGCSQKILSVSAPANAGSNQTTQTTFEVVNGSIASEHPPHQVVPNVAKLFEDDPLTFTLIK